MNERPESLLEQRISRFRQIREAVVNKRDSRAGINLDENIEFLDSLRAESALEPEIRDEINSSIPEIIYTTIEIELEEFKQYRNQNEVLMCGIVLLSIVKHLVKYEDRLPQIYNPAKLREEADAAIENLSPAMREVYLGYAKQLGYTYML